MGWTYLKLEGGDAFDTGSFYGVWLYIMTCFRSWREESDQEFVALCALLLCGDLQLKQDTFQAITNKQEVCILFASLLPNVFVISYLFI